VRRIDADDDRAARTPHAARTKVRAGASQPASCIHIVISVREAEAGSTGEKHQLRTHVCFKRTGLCQQVVNLCLLAGRTVCFVFEVVVVVVAVVVAAAAACVDARVPETATTTAAGGAADVSAGRLARLALRMRREEAKGERQRAQQEQRHNAANTHKFKPEG
jgi:hypothetical protein